MTADVPRTTAMGGERTVPEPDPIARDYLLLALRLGQRIEGLVDGYFGPADVKAHADTEQLRAPLDLARDAASLRERVETDIAEPDRRDWLARQLVALETHARVLAGEQLPYVDEIRRLFDWVPRRRDDVALDAAAAEIGRLLPGTGSVAERIATWDDGLVVPPERVPGLVDWLVERFRERAAADFGLPPGERLDVRLVRNQPWSGYNWYDGGLRSRVEVNLDLPTRVPALVATIAHETYPGHHLEHAWKEADLVERQGRLEASVLLLNAPECVVSEGLAELGYRFAVPPADEVAFLAEALERGAPRAVPDAAAAHEVAERVVALRSPRDALDEVAVNAALLRHADGWSHERVHDYLVGVGRMEPARAAKRLEFIEHPVSRSYVFVYDDGQALLRRWLDIVPEAERADRFARLLHEQLTPTALAAEVDGD